MLALKCDLLYVLFINTTALFCASQRIAQISLHRAAAALTLRCDLLYVLLMIMTLPISLLSADCSDLAARVATAAPTQTLGERARTAAAVQRL